MDNNKFDHLVPKVANDLLMDFFRNLERYPEFSEVIDTSPLLNLTVGVFIGTLVNVLDKIKEHTIGEVRLIENINLTQRTILEAIEKLPFVKKIEWIENT